MTEALKDRLYGQTKKKAVLRSGLRNNQTTGKTRIVSTLLVPSVATPGMMCRVINVITLPVSKVKGVI